MAAFDFPNSPSTNQTHTENGVTWKWNGTVWKRVESVAEKGQKGDKGDEKGQKGEVGTTTKGEKGSPGSATTGTTKIAILRDQKNYNVDGGHFRGDYWRDRDLTVEEDPQNFVTFTATTNGESTASAGKTPGYWSLPAGTYKIEFGASGHHVNRHQVRLVWDTTQSNITWSSSSNYNGDLTADNPPDQTSRFNGNECFGTSVNGSEESTTPIMSNWSRGSKVITITQTTYFKLLHIADQDDNSGFGLRMDNSEFSPDRYTEGKNIYAEVIIQDLATAVATDKGQKGEQGDDIKGQKGEQGTPGSGSSNASTVTVRTANDNAFKKILFVDSGTDNQNQTIKMDDENMFMWNPAAERLAAMDVQCWRLATWTGASLGTQGHILTSGGNGPWTWENPTSIGGVPSGGIIIWQGAVNAIPTGYVICDGQNSTPDLRNRFVIGAGDTYAVGNYGGSADAVVVSHSHGAAGSHQHTTTAYRPYWNNEDSETGWSTSTEWNPVASNRSIGSSAGSHTHGSTGVSGTGKNLPPFMALCYIMKT